VLVRIGRSENCDVVLDSDSVSGVHAHLEVLTSGAKLIDFGSTNGTFVNGQRISERELMPDDRIRLGLFTMLWTGRTLLNSEREVLWSSASVRGPEMPSWRVKPTKGRFFLWALPLFAALVVSAIFFVLLVSADKPIGVERLARGTAFIEVKDSYGTVCWTGSGAFLKDGLVLTNAHVAGPSLDDGDKYADCKTIEVSGVSDVSEKPTSFVRAEVVADDPGLDLAVLRVPVEKLSDATSLELALETLDLNEEVRVFGFPGTGGETLTLSSGVIAGFQEDSDGMYYKVTAKISPGSSGGPMIDERGNLVGISTAMNQAGIECSDEDCAVAGESFGLVRPVRYATPLLDEVRSQKK
jgi:hypothetical protein